MNMMNSMQFLQGQAATPEKNTFFFCWPASLARFDVHFRSSGSLNLLCEFEDGLFIVPLFNLMNIMKVYEVGVFMAIFLEAVLYRDALAGVYEGRNFINLQETFQEGRRACSL